MIWIRRFKVYAEHIRAMGSFYAGCAGPAELSARSIRILMLYTLNHTIESSGFTWFRGMLMAYP